MVLVSVKGQTANQLIREGNKLFSSKSYAQAEVLYRKAVDKEGGNAIANYNLGRSLQAQKKNEEAKKQYEKSAKLEKDPVRQSSSYNNMGTVLQDEKDYSSAIEAYKNALRHNPGHKNARYNLELCKFLLKKQQQQHKYLYWEFHEMGGRQAVRYKNWKGVRLNVNKDKKAPIELYDLTTDPAEQHNLAEKYPKIVKKLERFMEQSHTRSELFPFDWEAKK